VLEPTAKLIVAIVCLWIKGQKILLVSETVNTTLFLVIYTATCFDQKRVIIRLILDNTLKKIHNCIAKIKSQFSQLCCVSYFMHGAFVMDGICLSLQLCSIF